MYKKKSGMKGGERLMQMSKRKSKPKSNYATEDDVRRAANNPRLSKLDRVQILNSHISGKKYIK